MKVKVGAHRGAHDAGVKENSLAAFGRAVELGCDFVELDATARLEEAILEPQVEVAARAVVLRSILLGDNRVGEGAALSECIVGPGVEIPPGMSLHRTMVVAASGVTPEDLAEAQVDGGLALTPIEPPPQRHKEHKD